MGVGQKNILPFLTRHIGTGLTEKYSGIIILGAGRNILIRLV